MKIAVLGGSFDPPHLGHLLISEQVIEILNIDKVLLIPCYIHPFNKKLSNPEDRFRMTKFLENGKIEVSDLELKQKGISYTINTLNALKKQNPNVKIYFILGSDQIISFQKWKDWKDIITNYNIIIFPRDTKDPNLEEKIKKGFNLNTIPETIIILKPENLIQTDVSSTEIRNRVKEGKPIKGLVLPKVEEYIKEHNLYMI